MNTAIIICTRLDSSRIPNKAIYPFRGKPAIQILTERLLRTGFPVIWACPRSDINKFSFIAESIDGDVTVESGAYDPLERMAGVVARNNIKNIVRVTHDKIFVDPLKVNEAVLHFRNYNLDYLYSSSLTDGCGFEVIGQRAILDADLTYKNVEHVSYAIRAVLDGKNIYDYPFCDRDESIRLLIDYPEDIKLMSLIFTKYDTDAEYLSIYNYLQKYPELKKINRQPELTIYTCAHNAEKFIDKCMYSVYMQSVFQKSEYLIIDDASNDDTTQKIAEFALTRENVNWVKNTKNLGLSSSSNVALRTARGKYILRLDADDYFHDFTCAERILDKIQITKADVVYPDNYFGSADTVQSGDENHHVGGAIFKTSALNYLQFAEGLRGYEGYDLYLRAKDQLNIEYLKEPNFFYRQSNNSMSKTNLESRKEIKDGIEKRYSGAV